MPNDNVPAPRLSPEQRKQLENLLVMGDAEEAEAARRLLEDEIFADYDKSLRELQGNTQALIEATVKLQQFAQAIPQNLMKVAGNYVDSVIQNLNQQVVSALSGENTSPAFETQDEAWSPGSVIPQDINEAPTGAVAAGAAAGAAAGVVLTGGAGIAAGTAAAAAGAALGAVAGAIVGAVTKSTRFADLRDEYDQSFSRVVVRPERASEVAWYCNQIRRNRARYEIVSQATGVPWYFIGIIHGLESSFRFDRHLHNGDPLTARTRQVPKGRPATGNPPFTWEESAIDALRLKQLDGRSDWSTPQMLYRLEAYNGFGYRKRGLASPYLWSFCNLYEKGKYVADGKYDPNAVSKQCGAGVMLKNLAEQQVF
jgi:lysozyme family protein